MALFHVRFAQRTFQLSVCEFNNEIVTNAHMQQIISSFLFSFRICTQTHTLHWEEKFFWTGWIVQLQQSSVSLSHVTPHFTAVEQEALKSQKIQYNLAHTLTNQHTHILLAYPRSSLCAVWHAPTDPSVSSTHTYSGPLFINLHFNTHSGCRQHICSQQSLGTVHVLSHTHIHSHTHTHTHKQVLGGWDLIADTDIRSPPAAELSACLPNQKTEWGPHSGAPVTVH